MRHLFGIDIGTTGCKVGLYNEDLELITGSYRQYEIISRKRGWAEEDPNIWWQSTREAILECMKNASVNKDSIKGIGISCTNGIVAVDRDGAPLYNAIMQIDSRSDKQVAFLKDKIGNEKIFEVTGNRVAVGTFSAPIILWIKDEMPSVYEKTYKFLSPAGFIVQKLTGRFTFDHTRASTSLLYDIREGAWSEEILAGCGIDPYKLPEIFNSYEVVGSISEIASKEAGLAKSTKVIAGVMDSVAACLGTGTKAENNPALIVGTVARLCFPLTEQKFDNRFLNSVYSVNAPYLAMAPVNGGGLSIRWYLENFLEGEVETLRGKGIDPFEYLEEKVREISPGSNALVYLPYLVGERSPIWDSNARGVFFGVSMKTGRYEFYRAIMEGVAYATRHNLEIYTSEYGTNIDRIIISGGGGRSKIWAEIFADVLGIPIGVPSVFETETRGSAILAGYGVGLFEDLSCQSSDGNLRIIKPNEKNSEVYDQLFKIYRDIYISCKGSFEDLFSISR